MTHIDLTCHLTVMFFSDPAKQKLSFNLKYQGKFGGKATIFWNRPLSHQPHVHKYNDWLEYVEVPQVTKENKSPLSLR